MQNRKTIRPRPELATDRRLLRTPLGSDVPAIVAMVGNWDVARRLSRVPHPYGVADARFFLREIVPVEWVWAITLPDDEKLIGMIGLTPNKDACSAELGYWLSPQQWGRGIVTEAATKVVTFAFEALGLAYVTSGFFADNPASGRVLEKLGFVETGRTMLPCLASGADVPAKRMRLSRT